DYYCYSTDNSGNGLF
nr:immunoglobulin light chain junction region [Macaca mulatta]MOW02518.1 immunoglobulin light chain junction region [Macaca mulatta]MOW02583.1 immunoglobulin light chain junction region [Macaca mulatta]MOW03505.1 immunoglobulin light chain junction region [Macaca mulatta]